MWWLVCELESYSVRLNRRGIIPAKIPTELQSLLNSKVGKVLITEGYYLALSHEPGELVLPSVAEGAELNAFDLCANGGSEMIHANTIREQIGV